MTFEEFIVRAQSFRAYNPEVSLGQAYMVVLHDANYDLYNEVMEPGLVPLDPFYDDKNIGRFLAFIAERW